MNLALNLTWSSRCVIINLRPEEKCATTDAKLYAAVVALSIQDDAKLLEQLKSGFKGINNWNTYPEKSINRKTKPKFRLLN